MTAWLLTPDRTGSEAIYEVECTSCLAGSGPADDDDGPAVWALRHAWQTGHTGFRRIVTDFQRALTAD
ncbi:MULTISPECIES: hypothetical protein [unclassified Streptomyces]|uniref:DUF7848 domain-containing protein n=1 Tax=unclassified Streptomyces TaxID=2593676 RepID=UPI002E129423|nr:MULTISPECIES: hypothetical protein [unclassified Streptomyces]WSR26134.1 hypothetical protein OG573_08285 [Streptomyces sp. NBC_01205]